MAVVATSALADRDFEALPEVYPHPVTLDYNQEPLVCADGSVAWANQVLIVEDLPAGAAGAVVWTGGGVGALLHWEHPLYDPVSGNIVNMYASALNARSVPAISLVGLERPLNRPRFARGDGGSGVQIYGQRTQGSGYAFTATKGGNFIYNPGTAIDIFLGKANCANWLATYTFENTDFGG